MTWTIIVNHLKSSFITILLLKSYWLHLFLIIWQSSPREIIYSCYIRQPMYLSIVYFNRPLNCVTRAFLLIEYLSLRIIAKILLAEFTIFSTCECHCPVLHKVTPRCLRLSTKLIGALSRSSCVRKSSFLRIKNGLSFQWIWCNMPLSSPVGQ